MIAAFSTSGPRASVALIDDGGGLLYAADEQAQGRAGEALLRLLDEGLRSRDATLSNVDLFAADLGPGSFTGVRVGIVLAKTLAWQSGKPCAGADAFDLVDPFSTVALPSRKGEWFLRTPGRAIERTREEPPSVGTPLAAGFATLVARGLLRATSPYELVPEYLLEPSISKPKREYGRPD